MKKGGTLNLSSAQFFHVFTFEEIGLLLMDACMSICFG